MLWIILAFFAGLGVGAALMVVLFGARGYEYPDAELQRFVDGVWRD